MTWCNSNTSLVLWAQLPSATPKSNNQHISGIYLSWCLVHGLMGVGKSRRSSLCHITQLPHFVFARVCLYNLYLCMLYACVVTSTQMTLTLKAIFRDFWSSTLFLWHPSIYTHLESLCSKFPLAMILRWQDMRNNMNYAFPLNNVL